MLCFSCARNGSNESSITEVNLTVVIDHPGIVETADQNVSFRTHINVM